MSEIFSEKDENNNPRVSVIIPAYNVAGYISETLDSVFAQTYKDYEIIVVNDGSPDTETLEKTLEKYLDKIIYLEQENKGAAVARNTGIENSRGELIAFLDADDIWLPEFLDTQTKFLDANDYEMVYCDAYLFGDSYTKYKTFMEDAPSFGIADFEALLTTRCNVITSGTIVKKRNLFDVGMFEKEKVNAHDFILWLKLAKNGTRIGYQKKPLLKYRVLISGLSGDLVQRNVREIEAYRRVLKSMELDENQRLIVEQRIENAKAEIDIIRGKSLLLQKQFEEAETYFEKANRVKKSKKLQLIGLLTHYAPHLMLLIFQWGRAREIVFIPLNIE